MFQKTYKIYLLHPFYNHIHIKIIMLEKKCANKLSLFGKLVVLPSNLTQILFIYYKLLFYFNENLVDNKQIEEFIQICHKQGYNKIINNIKCLFIYLQKIYKISNKNKFPNALVRKLEIDSYLAKADTIKITNIRSPFNPDIKFNLNQIINIKVHSSANFPIQFDFKNISILYKNGDDLTNDLFIQKMVKFVGNIFDESVITYGIIPFDRNQGIIEIKENYLNIWNDEEMLEKWITNEGFQIKFINSLSFYLTISYIFGIGDRTINNILCTKDGEVFYIDFAYIFGQDPKFIEVKFAFPGVIYTIFKNDDILFKKLKTKIISKIISLRKHADMIFAYISNILDDPLYNIDKKEAIQYISSRLFLKINDSKTEFLIESFLISGLNSNWCKLNSKINKIGSWFRT